MQFDYKTEPWNLYIYVYLKMWYSIPAKSGQHEMFFEIEHEIWSFKMDVHINYPETMVILDFNNTFVESAVEYINYSNEIMKLYAYIRNCIHWCYIFFLQLRNFWFFFSPYLWSYSWSGFCSLNSPCQRVVSVCEVFWAWEIIMYESRSTGFFG